MLIFGLYGETLSISIPLVLVIALLLDVLFGEAPGPLRYLPHPVRIFGVLIDQFDRRLNRENRSDMDRRIRGAIAVLIIVSMAGGAGYGLAFLARHVPYGWMIEALAVTSLLAQRSLYRHVRDVAAASLAGGLSAGQQAVGHIVGRDVRTLDEHGVARAAIESCAENFSDGVVAPTLYYLLFGLPGIFAYKAINTLDSMIGHRSPRHRAFGMVAARLDDLVNLIPARLSGLLLVLASAAVPTAQASRAFAVMLRDAGKHRSPNAGWPEAAMAGALGLTLAGPRWYGGAMVDDAWIGEGSSQATEVDVFRALLVFVVACLVNLIIVAGLAALPIGHV